MALFLPVVGCGAGHEAVAPATGRWLGAQRIDGTPPASSRASLPSLAVDGSGRAVVVWASNYTILANRFVPGRGWGVPEIVTAGLGTANEPVVAMNDSGVALVVWRANEGRQGDPYRVWASGSSSARGWSEPEVIDGGATLDWWQYAAAVDAAGTGVVLWTSNGIVTARHEVDQGWSPPERLSATGAAPSVASGPASQAIAAWGEGGTIVAATYEARRGWSGVTRFEPEAGWHAFSTPALAVDPRGRALLAWESREGDGYGPAVVSAAQFDPDAWSGPSVVSDRAVQSYGPSVALDSSGGLVAWTILGFGAGVGDGVFFSRFAFSSGYESPSRVASGDNAVTVGAALSHTAHSFVAWAQTEPQPGTGVLWYRLWASRYAGGVWAPAERLQSGPGPAQYPQVAADDEGNALVVWAEDEGDSTRVWSNRFEVGAP